MKMNFKENFERFLKDNADEYRIYPSERVWNGIVKDLNRRKRWLGFTFGAFLLVASLFGYYVVDNNKSQSIPIVTTTSEVNNSSQTVPASTSTELKNNQTQVSKENFNPYRNLVDSAEPKNEKSALNNLQTASKSITISKPLNSSFPIPELISYVNKENSGVVPSIEKANSSQLETEVKLTGEKETATQKEISANETNASSNETEPLLTIEKVNNLYKAPIKTSKLTYQLYFTPTVSYRKLTENKSYLRNVPQSAASPGYSALYDIKNAVTHKPDIGIELGFTAKYPITNIIKLRGGVQFNVSRYSIKAFNHSPEVATIALNRGDRVNSVNTVSSYRNFNGYQANWLQNFYFQVSAPVGLEIRLKGAEKTHFGMATTIQPTYVLGERAYLLSSDYKNYTEVPWLIRRWNANTNLEAFVSYSTGKLKWQVGPQVRYQLLSSFVTEYPVKENLFDYGLKVGISLNKQP